MIASGAVSVAEAPIVALAVAKTSPIRDARDLSGKTIACTNLVDISILGVYAWLSKNGVPVDSVKVIELPFSTMAAALNRGTVDAAVLAEPALSAGRDQVRLLPEVFATVGKRWLVTCWFGKTDYVRANADAMKRYARAIYAAGKYANARPAQTAPILAAKSNMTAASIGAMTPIIFTEQVDERDIQPELDLAYKFKLIERPITYAELAGK
jgi:NitT/TauT family transport system substrate-binding protein